MEPQAGGRAAWAWRCGVVALIALLLWPDALRPTPHAAAKDASTVDAATLKARKNKLKLRTQNWWGARRRFPSRCPRCKGQGKVMQRKGRHVFRVQCRQCQGKGKWISKKHFKIAYYEMKTPAFQAMPDVEKELNRIYIATSVGKPWPTVVQRYWYKGADLIDATHAISWTSINGVGSPQAMKWVWVPTRKKRKGDWCVYDSRCDGPWPEGPEPAVEDSWTPLTPAEHERLRYVLVRTRLRFRVFEALRRGGTLWLRMMPLSTEASVRNSDFIGADAVQLTRGLLEIDAPFEHVRTDWHMPWTSALGQARMLPTWRAELSRAQARSLSWAHLPADAQVGALTWTAHEHAGWTREEEPAPDVQEPPDEAAPAPTPEPAPAPGPTPAPPAPTPRAPTPPTPSAPEPEDPGTWSEDAEIPELTSAQKKKADAIFEQMKKHLADAEALNQEAAQAHQDNLQDLWQAKLSEVRSKIGEVEDLWNEDLLEVMPGNDYSAKEAVANEYYGSIWSSADKIRAAARKLGRS